MDAAIRETAGAGKGREVWVRRRFVSLFGRILSSLVSGEIGVGNQFDVTVGDGGARFF
jgi:hypothetical protein